jgi:simple sugar transport system ATP-binding protein
MAGIHRPIVNHSPKEAQENGISTVYQEVNLCPNLTVAENLFIGREPKKAGFIDWKAMNRRSEEVLKRLAIEVSPSQMLAECSIALQQMIAIARAVDMKCKVLILDEPTSSLDEEEVEKLFLLMKHLRSEGVGIIFVTHFLEQVYAVSDRITVLRNGELVGEYETINLPRLKLVAKMMGKDFDDLADIKGEQADVKTEESPFIEAIGLGHQGTIKPFWLSIHRGEVIGLTGLLGSGRSELVRAIYGADKADSGILKINGKEVKIHTPLEAMKHGIGYLPEDRKKEGIIQDLSVRENIIIAMQAKRGLFKPMNRKEMEEAADRYIDVLQIKTANRDTPIKNLSGGNQQKVIIGRWLLTNPEYLILDEPTRGIDIGTKTQIQKLVLELAREGKAVTFISSEVEEMLRTCSKMVVLRDGEKVGEIQGSGLTQDNIMKMIAGGDRTDEEKERI